VTTQRRLLASFAGKKLRARPRSAPPFRPRRVYTLEEVRFLTAWDCWGEFADLALEQARALGELEERGRLPMTPTPVEFVAMLEAQLRCRRVPFSRGALQGFVESAWELIGDNPDPEYWRARFLELGPAVEVPD
jgi:hypothetical protein